MIFSSIDLKRKKKTIPRLFSFLRAYCTVISILEFVEITPLPGSGLDNTLFLFAFFAKVWVVLGHKTSDYSRLAIPICVSSENNLICRCKSTCSITYSYLTNIGFISLSSTTNINT